MFSTKDSSNDVPVLLVANKIDQCGDRMISKEEGHRRYREIGCVGFKEISVRESIEQVMNCYVYIPIGAQDTIISILLLF